MVREKIKAYAKAYAYVEKTTGGDQLIARARLAQAELELDDAIEAVKNEAREECGLELRRRNLDKLCLSVSIIFLCVILAWQKL